MRLAEFQLLATVSFTRHRKAIFKGKNVSNIRQDFKEHRSFFAPGQTPTHPPRQLHNTVIWKSPRTFHYCVARRWVRHSQYVIPVRYHNYNHSAGFSPQSAFYKTLRSEPLTALCISHVAQCLGSINWKNEWVIIVP